MERDPSGIDNDRAFLRRIEEGEAVLAVGPSRTPLRVPADDLPSGAQPGTWVVVDTQQSPPMILSVDEAMTAERDDPPD